eukprot:Tbor_TRINITY_DN5308_c0_g2::TRINITY_DN5308_c0_g2_i1::g.4111::m.4111
MMTPRKAHGNYLYILTIALSVFTVSIVTSSCVSILAAAKDQSPLYDPIKLANLPIDDIAGQMTQLDISNFMDTSSTSEYKINKTKLKEFVDNRRIGSLMNVPPPPKNALTSIPTVDDWRRMMDDIF